MDLNEPKNPESDANCDSNCQDKSILPLSGKADQQTFTVQVDKPTIAELVNVHSTPFNDLSCNYYDYVSSAGDNYKCRMCDIDLANMDELRSHLKTFKHANVVGKFRVKWTTMSIEERPKHLDKLVFYCDLCAIQSNSFSDYTSHFCGNVHLARMKSSRESNPNQLMKSTGVKETIRTAIPSKTSISPEHRISDEKDHIDVLGISAYDTPIALPDCTDTVAPLVKFCSPNMGQEIKEYSREFMETLAPLPISNERCDYMMDLPEIFTSRQQGVGGLLKLSKKLQVQLQYTTQSQPPDSQEANVMVTVDSLLEVTLHKSEHPWQIKSDSNDVEKLCKQVKGILNKLTTRTFESLLNEFRSLNIQNNTETLTTVTDCIFQHCLKETKFISLYVKLIVHQKLMDVNAKSSLRNCFLSKCQQQFEIHFCSQQMAEPDNPIDTHNNCQPDKSTNTFQNIKLAIIRVVGQLYLQDILPCKIIANCLRSLTIEPDSSKTECLCTLLSLVGKKLDEGYLVDPNMDDTSRTNISLCYSHLEKLLRANEQLSIRGKCLIKNLLALRANGWKPRIIKLSWPHVLSTKEQRKIQQPIATNGQLPDKMSLRRINKLSCLQQQFHVVPLKHPDQLDSRKNVISISLPSKEQKPVESDKTDITAGVNINMKMPIDRTFCHLCLSYCQSPCDYTTHLQLHITAESAESIKPDGSVDMRMLKCQCDITPEIFLRPQPMPRMKLPRGQLNLESN